MKRLMLLSTLIGFIAALLSWAAYRFTLLPAILSFAITFSTIVYHLAMRLAVGYAFNAIFHNNVDHRLKWFRERRFEPKFYAFLRVRKWKRRFPTFKPDDFDVKNHSALQLARASCQSELVHELIILLSFVPVLFAQAFGAAIVFWITSLLAALFDCCFVIIQRYNRPRLLKFAEKLGE